MAPKPKDKSRTSASQPPPAIEDLFTSLNRHIQQSEYEQAVRVADQVLSIAPGDEDAIRCKVVALVKDDKIEDALSVIRSSHKIPIDFSFHKAYCLYRQSKLDEALESLKSQEKNSSTLLLESQILYRLGKIDACVEVYQKLQNSKVDSLEINLVAGLVSARRASEVHGVLGAMRIKATSSFELAYNTACSLIETEKYSDAEQLLLAARSFGIVINLKNSTKSTRCFSYFEKFLDESMPRNVQACVSFCNHLMSHDCCLTSASEQTFVNSRLTFPAIMDMFLRIGQETLTEDNFADDDVEIELAPIAVQLAYVQQLLGQKQEATVAYTDIINRNLADETSLAVAVNNLIASRGPKDVSDGLRKLDLLKDKDSQTFQLSAILDSKLSLKQKEALYANRTLLLLHANKMDQAREFVAGLQAIFPDNVMPVLLQAAVLVRENKAAKAEELLGQYASKFSEKSRVALLARAQIAAAAGHPLVAAESLSKIQDIQHMPATVATLVALKERAGDITGAASVLDSAIKWWSNSMTEDNKLSLVMQEAAAFKLRHGEEEEASRLYEEIVKSHKSTDALVGLVTTIAHVNVDKAESYEKQLKPLPGLKGVDVDNLEKTSSAKHVEAASVPEANEEVKNKEKPKRKRKRKPRYPKGFDPANPGPPPDPERWLPKRERSSYRPKRKDKRAAQIRGSQGAVMWDKQDDGASGSNANVSNANSRQSTSSKGSSQNAGAGNSRASSKSSRKKSRK